MKKCSCKSIMGMSSDRTLYVHLYGCPDTKEYNEYMELKWYKKIFTRNPYKLYLENLQA